MDIAIAADHGGFDFKGEMTKPPEKLGHAHRDLGPYDRHDVDCPDYPEKVAAAAPGEFERGILICGTHRGMAMTARRVKDMRGSPCRASFSARVSR